MSESEDPVGKTPPAMPANPAARVQAQAKAQSFLARRARLNMIIAGVLVLVGLIAIGVSQLKRLVSIQPTAGIPLANSVRSVDRVATLIQTREAYVPSPNRNPDNDRFSVSLFVFPIDGSSPGKMYPIAKGLQARDFNLSKLYGDDGVNVWFNLKGFGGINLQSGKLISGNDLTAANRTLKHNWDDYRRYDFDRRLRFTSEDRRQVYELVPESLKAVAPTQPVKPRSPIEPKAQDFLATGVRPTPEQWLGLHSLTEAQTHFRIGSTIGPKNPARDAKELRQIHRGTLGPDDARRRNPILTLTPVSDQTFLNAAFILDVDQTTPIQAVNADSFVMTYTATPGLGGTLVVAAIDTKGAVLWSVDTGLHRFLLQQILPGQKHVAFVGPRPAVAGKVAEPILVIVDTQTGKSVTSTLLK